MKTTSTAPSTLKLRLKTAVSQLLAMELDAPELPKVVQQIHSIFQEASQITGFDQKLEYLAAVPTTKGKALGLNHAAQCLLDYHRTHLFLKGMYQSITQLLAKQKSPVHVCYAGCGPYAPFMNLIAVLFTPEEVQFTLLEINEHSLKAAQNTSIALEHQAYVRAYFCADATSFSLPEATSYHLLFSETLDALLYRECYVPILANLLRQLPENTTVIPHNVSLQLSKAKTSLQEGGLDEQTLNELFNTRELLKKHQYELPAVIALQTIPLQTLSPTEYPFLIVDTCVHVTENLQLKRGSSSLSLALELQLAPENKQQRLQFQYVLSPEIELQCHYLPE